MSFFDKIGARWQARQDRAELKRAERERQRLRDPGPVSQMGPVNRRERRRMVQSTRVAGRAKRGVRRPRTQEERLQAKRSRALRRLTHMRRPLLARVPNSRRDGLWKFKEAE